MLPIKLQNTAIIKQEIDNVIPYWLAIWHEDGITTSDLTQVFFREQNMPVITFNHNGEKFIPFFDSNLVAARFAQRNLGKGAIVGTITITDVIKKEIKERNIHAAHFCFPSKIIDVVGVELYPELVTIEKDTAVVPINR